MLEWDQHGRLDACLEEGARIVSFFWGDPLPYVADVHGVPVLAAGGIADGRGLAAALALGAGGAMLGTRFLLTHESDTHSAYRAALSQATVTDTAYSTVFDGGWPAWPEPGWAEFTAARQRSESARRLSDVLSSRSLIIRVIMAAHAGKTSIQLRGTCRA